MQLRTVVLVGLLAFFSVRGCEQRIPKDELGNVIFDLPKVPGGDKPPPTPELDESSETEDAKSAK